jgi:carboxyl-terminal processing protease
MFAAITVLLFGGILGGIFGDRVQADSRRAEDQVWTFGRVLALVEDQYVGPVDSEELVENAILGMLATLDPHSNFLNAESFAEMRDEQRGKFSGLGIQITKRGSDKPLTIIAPIDGTPAHRAGLMSGDEISHIEGHATMEMTVQDAVRLLKGNKGTEVTITIQRPALNEPFDVTIERDDIPIESIRVAFLVEPDIGLVRIANFTSTTADELDGAIESLTEQGMKRLILDLRGNPGGLLDQAVQVSERFIPAGKLVVYTRGRIPGSNQDYVAKRGVERVDMPMVVLVDRSSASASEIVSGAVQDHDRGLVVGETTFGKGLVQRVIPLRNGGGALAVTTAKYYTPSGRLIQRDYTDLEEYYLRRPDDEQPEELGNMDDLGLFDDKTDAEVFYTASGRKVFGGGGIRPDYIVKAQRAPEILSRMIRQNLIFDFAVLHTNTHPELERGFEISSPLLDELRSYLGQREFEFENADFAEHADVIKLRLRAQIARVKWDQIEEARVLAQADPQIQRALKVFDESSNLSERGALGEPGRRAPEELRAEVELEE